jgi:hypothetical protein
VTNKPSIIRICCLLDSSWLPCVLDYWLPARGGMLTHLQLGCTDLTHGHLLCGDPVSVRIQYSVAFNTLHIWVECPHYVEDHLTFYLHGWLNCILGDDQYSVFNILAFCNGVGVAKSVPVIILFYLNFFRTSIAA